MYEFNVGPVIATKKPKSTWCLHVRAMSGDADHYEHNTSHFKNVEDLSKHFSLLDAFCRLGWNAGCDEKIVNKTIKTAAEAVKLDVEEAMDWYSEFVGHDVTYDEYRARPDRVWVTYFDETGVEHNVTINSANDAQRGAPVLL